MFRKILLLTLIAGLFCKKTIQAQDLGSLSCKKKKSKLGRKSHLP